MSEIIKWSETNVGKYSMFSIELGEIKTEISCDFENSEKLISLLKELEHGHATMSEENEKLKQQIKTSVLLSEAEKNTLALMRSQIDELLGAEVVEPIPRILPVFASATTIFNSSKLYLFLASSKACSPKN